VPGFFVGGSLIPYHPAMTIAWKKLGWALPGASAGGIAALLWAVGAERGNGASFIGWLSLVLLLATAGGVIGGTAPRPMTAVAFLAGLLTLGIGGLGMGGGFIGFAEWVEVSAVLVAWTALWAALAWSLGLQGRGIASVLPIVLAIFLMALPVVAMPLIHAAGTSTRLQRGEVEFVRRASPQLACVEAAKHRLRVDWAQSPNMYALSGLGQEVPMELPNGWSSAAIYAAGAALAGGIGFFILRRKPT
jgi:hypothetical protein